MTAIIELLNRLLALLQGWQRKREQKERQDSADDLQSDPANWYNRKFGGVPDDHANETDKTDPDSDTKQ